MADVTDAGIAGMAYYFPRRAVALSDLEAFDDVSPGKYTAGLGQNKMAVPHDSEDAVSMCLTVLQRLVDRYGISFGDIGRLEVGTESRVDGAKSVKSSLMQLFEASGNCDCEGLDNTNACYGSTAALFNTVAWVESSAWDGRYGVVVAADIAVYAPGPARPTGGAGAIAMLVGRGAECPLRFEVGLRASCFGNSYDFFKPARTTEYPTVNGEETVACFVRAIDSCYKSYKRRAGEKTAQRFRFDGDVDYFCCHSPFGKMVQRALARLVYLDSLDAEGVRGSQEDGAVDRYRALPRATSHLDKSATRALVARTRPAFDAKCDPGAWLAREIGNAYTASLYGSLAALVRRRAEDLVGRRILMFAFGSGFASSMFSLRVVGSVARIARSLEDIEDQLEQRLVLTAAEYDAVMRDRERDHGRFGYKPVGPPSELFPGTFFVASVGREGQRAYERTPHTL
jgi:hydroxymethylglutaryl-CoA synthase